MPEGESASLVVNRACATGAKVWLSHLVVGGYEALGVDDVTGALIGLDVEGGRRRLPADRGIAGEGEGRRRWRRDVP